MTKIPPKRPPKAARSSPPKPAAPPAVTAAEPLPPPPPPSSSPSPSSPLPSQPSPSPSPSPTPRKRIRPPLTPEQRARRNAARRRLWAATQDQRLPLSRYTLRQRNLIEAYLRLGAVAPAAREAGYTRSSATNWAWQFLRRPDVAAIIEARQAEMRRRCEVTMERVIGELAKLAFADPRDLFTADGRLKPVHELDDASAASISALEVLAVASGRRPSPARRQDAGRIGARMKAAAADAGPAAAASPDAARGAALDSAGAAGSIAVENTAAGNTAAGNTAAAGIAGGGDMVLELRKIKRWDKTKALELLGRYLGLFKDRLELGIGADLAASIEAARKRSGMLAPPAAALVIDAPVIDGQVIDAQMIDAQVMEGRGVEVHAGEGDEGAAGRDET
jgi:hypothetical protein